MAYFNNSLIEDEVQQFLKKLASSEEEGFSSSYESRLEQVSIDCLQLVQKYDEMGEDSQLFTDINKLISQYKEIYMEIGMQAGVILAKDMIKAKGTQDNSGLKYKEMYMSLFKDVSKVVEDLQKAQQKAEDIYISI